MTKKRTTRRPTKYPTHLNGREVWEYIQKISGPHDAHEPGDDDYEPWPASEKYVLKRIRISDIRFVGDYENERIDDFASRSTPFPPIAVWSDLSILDGQHRVNAARQRGDELIDAYVHVQKEKRRPK